MLIKYWVFCDIYLQEPRSKFQNIDKNIKITFSIYKRNFVSYKKIKTQLI